jgi:hypothetical protein
VIIQRTSRHATLAADGIIDLHAAEIAAAERARCRRTSPLQCAAACA